MIEQTTVGVAQMDLEGRYEMVNPRFCEIVGRSADEVLGMGFRDITHPDDVPGNEALFRGLVNGGSPFNIEKRYLRPDGTLVWVSNYVSLIADDDGKPVSSVVVVLDITQPKLAAEHREMLLSELNHRVKNSLATVQAIVTQSLANAADLDGFRESFMSRLLALAGTHDLLAKDNWQGVGLHEIVRAELAPYITSTRSPEIEGDVLQLNPKIGLALSLALHELATNAGKYGALSSAEGSVRVSWETVRRDEGNWLEVRWSEHDGPAVQPPSRRGFGTRLIREGMAHELGAEVELDFPVTGVVCTMAVPLPDPDARDESTQRTDGRG